MRILRALSSVVILGLVISSTTQAQPPGSNSPGPVPQWIWSSFLERQHERAWFRDVLYFQALPTKAELKLWADDQATLYLNGVEVARSKSSSAATIVDLTGKFELKSRNLLAVEAVNHTGPAGILVQLTLTPERGPPVTLVSDPRWMASSVESVDWKVSYDTRFDGPDWHPAVSKGLIGCPPWDDHPVVDTPDYHQWKQALGGTPATQAAAVQVLPGFQVELVSTSQPGEGSWVSLALDPQGRLTIGREGPGILRYTLPSPGVDGQPDQGRMEVVNDTLLECRGLLYAHGSLYAQANNSKGFYRLKDTDGDDRFDEVKLLKTIPGGVGHGRNDLTLGPDGKIYLIFGNDAKLPEDFQVGGSPFRNYADDRLLKCSWDKYLFDRNATLPAGHVIRTDADGQTWEVFAGGMRNPYGLDFSPAGELFTFDADNEGDMGLPWYRPTRVLHVVSGGDYGWRQGSGIRPQWFPDTLPAVLDVGKASPTGVKFGTNSNFPEPYKSALFILDWSYGRIYAVHLLPREGSYAATAELLVAGKPLNVTDLEFGKDGAMYFVTGGRGTQSALYRVTCVDPELLASRQQFRQWRSTQQAEDSQRVLQTDASAHRVLRARTLFHSGDSHPDDLGSQLYNLSFSVRYAERIGLESIPKQAWFVAPPREDQRMSIAGATLHLARARDNASAERQIVLTRFNPGALEQAKADVQLTFLRAVQVALARHGIPPSREEGAGLRRTLEAIYPSDCRQVNQLACELLVYLESPRVVESTLLLLRTADTQEEILLWLFLLRNVKTGWTPELRKIYVEALHKANAFEGGRDMVTALTSIRYEFLANVPPGERAALMMASTAQGTAEPVATTSARAVVKEWKLDDLQSLFANEPPGDPGRGKEVYAAANCLRCHRVKGSGQPVGPDLTGAALRFSRKDLLTAIVEPSKSIDDKFRNVTFELASGRVVSGRVITGDDERLIVSPSPLEPDVVELIPLEDVEQQTTSSVSAMPNGLLNTFTLDEIRDLLAYLDSLAH